jgi:hypothetical protein
MEDATWLALTLALTVMAGTWTWFVARPKGAPALIRGAAITLLPPAAYLTGTLEAGVEIGAVLGDWATALVFSPKVWLGLVLAGVSVLLFVVSGFLRKRAVGDAPAEAPADKLALPSGKPGKPGTPAIDDDLAEIEALLRKRGIS